MQITGEMLTTGEVARRSGYSIDTIGREISRGNLKAVKLGRYWWIEDREASRWAAQFERYASMRKKA